MTIDFAALLEGGTCIECGTTIQHFGVCDSCAAKFDRERDRQSWVLRMESLQTIGPRFRWATFDASEIVSRCGVDRVAVAKRVCEQIAGGVLKGAILWCASTATGKTSLATAMMQHLVQTDFGLRARWQCAVELVAARGRYGEEPWHVDASIRASLLVLDDVGNEDAGRKHVLRRVMQARHNAGKPTIVTTWMHPDKLEAVYGEGTGRRFTERVAVIPMGGSNA